MLCRYEMVDSNILVTFRTLYYVAQALGQPLTMIY